MSEGFNNKLKVEINSDEVDKLLKQYKKIKKLSSQSENFYFGDQTIKTFMQ